MSDKIKPQHVGRKAMLYVRQSSAYQVNHNLESQRLQYAMQDRLHHLGWREIEVVDEDKGSLNEYEPRSLTAALRGSATREGAARRAPGGRPGRVSQNRCAPS